MSDELVKRLRDECEDATDPIFMTRATLLKAADRIEQLEANNNRWKRAFDEHGGRYWEARYRDEKDRIEKLEAALRWYAEHCQKGGDDIEGPEGDYGERARKALEGKDD